jgi:DNA-binding transcriptional LysR family regulator
MRNQALEVCRRAGVVRPGDAASDGANLEVGDVTDRNSRSAADAAADAAVGPPPGVSFESGSFETLLPLVRRRAGITLVPALLTMEGTPHGVIYRPFRSPPPSRRIGIVTLRDHRPTIPIGALVTTLQERVAPTLGSPQAGEGRILEPFPEGL